METDRTRTLVGWLLLATSLYAFVFRQGTSLQRETEGLV
jgi:hypothetical protein